LHRSSCIHLQQRNDGNGEFTNAIDRTLLKGKTNSIITYSQWFYFIPRS